MLPIKAPPVDKIRNLPGAEEEEGNVIGRKITVTRGENVTTYCTYSGMHVNDLGQPTNYEFVDVINKRTPRFTARGTYDPETRLCVYISAMKLGKDGKIKKRIRKDFDDEGNLVSFSENSRGWPMEGRCRQLRIAYGSKIDLTIRSVPYTNRKGKRVMGKFLDGKTVIETSSGWKEVCRHRQGRRHGRHLIHTGKTTLSVPFVDGVVKGQWYTINGRGVKSIGVVKDSPFTVPMAHTFQNYSLISALEYGIIFFGGPLFMFQVINLHQKGGRAPLTIVRDKIAEEKEISKKLNKKYPHLVFQ